MGGQLLARDVFFYNLESALVASAIAVTDVVTVPQFPTTAVNRSLIPMYCDVDDQGNQIMNRRLSQAPKDISDAMQIHESLLFAFYNVKLDIIESDRFNLVKNSEDLCRLMTNYSNLVWNHQSTLKGDSFLYHFASVPGHRDIFGNAIMELSFNTHQTESGAALGINALEESAVALFKSPKSVDENYVKRVKTRIDDYNQNFDYTKFILEKFMPIKK